LQFPFIVFLIGFILGPMFERSLRHTLILFDDPVSTTLQHPLLPILSLLGFYLAWRALRAKRRPEHVLARASSDE
jgi:TctA family transporter